MCSATGHEQSTDFVNFNAHPHVIWSHLRACKWTCIYSGWGFSCLVTSEVLYNSCCIH